MRRVREVRRDSKLKFGWTAGIDNTEHMPLMSKLVAADLVDREWQVFSNGIGLKADKEPNIGISRERSNKEILVNRLSL